MQVTKVPSQIVNRGVSFTGLLTILFVGLKLTNYINWSWWWVVSPLWIPIVVCLVVLAVVFGGWIFLEWLTIRKKKKNKKKKEEILNKKS